MARTASDNAQQLKQALLQAVSRSNNPRQGNSPLEVERAVEAAAAALAAANPTPAPAASPALLGAWALLFSGRCRGELAAAAARAGAVADAAGGVSLQQALQAASDSLYSTFYQYLPVLAGSAVGARRGAAATNLQVLRPGRVDNVVSTRGPLPLRLCVSGSTEQATPSCVAVRFDSFTARVGGLPEAALSLAWLRPLGYVDTLYLDAEMRISVGDKGGLFVLRRAAGAEVGGDGGV
ncbi:Plastid lipid-associated fibrillin conserved domain [Micractinium conductrix]|uniref:Plastid lipid-associated fibrillin conserved domain n=1 Tax=Micractinium conductrix TaxID=554055 RepID=A0A2P6V5I6_9CHLO|nr:Plastid lipid-associated fibrillin conserved domain [Micractinium conductrix]|eukprot:PSC69346.1 Plastid lipid-associated fibrillin conserved domain [Micractinium conductrix]